MMQYFLGKPNVTDEMIAIVRKENPQLPDDMLDDDLIPLIKDMLIKQPIDFDPATNALDLLQQYGLATRQHAQQTAEGRPYQVASYRLHDLGFEYSQAQHTDETRNRAVDACLAHIARYKEASLANFASLDPNIDTYMSASAFAMTQGRYQQVEDFADGLYIGANTQGGVFVYRGYNSLAITVLQQATQAAEQAGNPRNQGAHLGNLGNAYNSLGRYQEAIDYHQQALAISREIGDKRGEGSWLGNLGNAYFSLGRYQEAIAFYEQALAISREIGDKRNEGSWLGNLGNAYASLGRYQEAINYHQQALAISREIGDKRGEGADLGNLGTAYGSLGRYQEAIDYHQQALAVFHALGVPHLIEQAERLLANAQQLAAQQSDGGDAE